MKVQVPFNNMTSLGRVLRCASELRGRNTMSMQGDKWSPEVVYLLMGLGSRGCERKGEPQIQVSLGH